jgi:signal transduction histidine kinase
LARIKTAVEQGSGIVRAMLGYGRVREKEWVICDLNQVVEQTVKLLDERMARHVSIQVETDPTLAPAPGAKDLLQQMLLNLILNAAEAMDGTGTLRVRSGLTHALPSGTMLAPAAAAAYAYVSVQDTGPGIAPEVLPRIFEPFFSTKSLSTRRGTGLGLTMVYEFAKEMSYGLAVESAQGRGATFTVLIPTGEAKSNDSAD